MIILFGLQLVTLTFVLQALWQVNGGVFHRDVSAREALAARHSVDHLLHLQRLQRAVIREAAIARSRLEAAVAVAAELRDAAYLPPASAARSWLWQCKAAIDAACCAAGDAALMLKGLLAAETSVNAHGSLPATLAVAVHADAAMREVQARLASKCFTQKLPGLSSGDSVIDPHSFPQLVLPAMLDILTTAFETADLHRAALESVAHGPELPGWSSLLVTFAALCELRATHAAQLEVWSSTSGTSVAPLPFVSDVDQLMGDVLLWAQAVHNTVDVKPESASEGCTKITEWMSLLEKQLGLTRLHSLGERFELLCSLLASMSDAGDSGTRGAAAVLCRSSPPFALVSAATARLAADYISLHKSTAKLCGTLAGTFCSLARDGFCAPQPDGDQGADTGGELQDDKAGTGIGEGQGKKDVSDEIEDEAQVLGLEDLQKEDAAQDAAPDDPAHGLEMAADFEGEMHELEHDPEGDDDAPEAEAEADQLDKEVRISPSIVASIVSNCGDDIRFTVNPLSAI